MPDEKMFMQEGGVTVTSTRFITPAKTHAMAGITAVSAQEKKIDVSWSSGYFGQSGKAIFQKGIADIFERSFVRYPELQFAGTECWLRIFGYKARMDDRPKTVGPVAPRIFDQRDSRHDTKPIVCQ